MNVSGIHSTSPLWAVDSTNASSRVTDQTPRASTNAADYLTESDQRFLLNGLGVTITPTDDGYFMTSTEPISDDEWVARQAAASDLMEDRKRGDIQGDVSPAYLNDLLARAQTDSSKAFQDVLQQGLDYFAKGSDAAHVNLPRPAH